MTEPVTDLASRIDLSFVTFTEESTENPCDSTDPCDNVAVWRLCIPDDCGHNAQTRYCDPCRTYMDHWKARHIRLGFMSLICRVCRVQFDGWFHWEPLKGS